ncbi:hypothetical protein C5E07_04900 [Pseudoclavibacter sp. RFBJ3]|uniref:hypothetical protein n=1 Tax=unclassified Pseudoclavibacter TaxID=2615177 RepID=UPI000CE8D467|nr:MULTISPECIES: hypothetical protein [unclassified Pseudoclavibacter]PPF84848.1 hypothetical protein C5C12_05605 [Pseudoclavibacter sp. RFBJ5]PPF93852.1 hypothetical protein C5E07_04900 [Pseudoclavibacter sp. RFBJ3]PPF98570.1 hypothetical protein C5C19_07885 [Pseudoclavibacter sp. RFBH5]PPG24471.1 hypothetical protein C5E13_06985 [Pseudoclavibacter sp. RFBI4]
MRARGSNAAGNAYRGAHGPGRVLVVVYAVLALASMGRSSYQLLSKLDEAPLAYSLSAAAALVYLLATIALVRHGRAWNLVAWCTIVFELVGVLVVGSLTEFHPELFPSDTVWSAFGVGYAYIPLVLPILGIAWLETGRSRRKRERAAVH